MAKKRISFVLALSTGQFSTALTMAQKKLTRVSKQMKNVGSTMSRNVTAPFVAIGAAGAKMAIDFDKNMTKIETLVGLTGQEVNAMRGEVMKLSGATAQAPAELADGLFFLTSAGLRGANAMETLEAVSKGVAIGLGEQTDLAKVAAAAQNAYGADVLSASEALDIFGGMVQTGMFEASDLAGVLGTQLGLASNLGISFEELGAMISTYTKTTGDANAATTGLSGVMMSFAKITPQQVRALESVGMSVEGVRESLSQNGLQATLIEMQGAFQASGVDLSAFFSKSQALKGVLGVLGTQTETYKEVLDDLGDSAGFVENGFERVSEGPGFKLQKTFNDLKLAGQQLGEALLPFIVKLANVVTTLVNKFTSLSKTSKTVVAGIGILVASIGPAISIIGGIGSAFVALTGPIGIAIAAIAGIGAAFIYIRHNWDATKERLGDMDFIKNSMIDLLQFIVENNPFSLLIQGYNKAVSYLGGTQIPNPFEGILDGLDEYKSETKEFEHEFSTFGEAMRATGNEVKNALVNMVGTETTGAVEEVKENVEEVEEAIEKIGNTTQTTTEKLKTFFGMTSENFSNMVTTIAEKAEMVNQVVQSMNTVFQAFTDRKSEMLRRQTEDEKAQLEEQHQLNVERIENMEGSEEQKNALLEQLETDHTNAMLDIEEKAGKEQRKIQRKQAKAQKVADIFSIVASTARSIQSAVAASPLTGGMPWSGINAGIGAAQVAAVLAQPLPALAKGGLAFGDTLARVGDNPNAQMDPEVIAPLSKLQNMIGNERVEVIGRISGQDILLANKRAQNRLNTM